MEKYLVQISSISKDQFCLYSSFGIGKSISDVQKKKKKKKWETVLAFTVASKTEES